MNIGVVIPKEDPRIPDCYSVTIIYYDGKTEELEIVDHGVVHEGRILSFVTASDEYGIRPLSTIRKVDFDKRYSKIVALKMKKEKKSA